MAGKPKDLTGQKFGMLTALQVEGHMPVRWLCKCDCGQFKTIRAHNLLHGASSCGCQLEAHQRSGFNKSHGQSTSRLYRIWVGMLSRCSDVRNANYRYYGAKGIQVCPEWQSFEGFFADMGSAYQEGLTIDRIDPKRGYEPSNCEWVTRQENAHRRWGKGTYDSQPTRFDDYISSCSHCGKRRCVSLDCYLRGREWTQDKRHQPKRRKGA